jgi:hypothetical protein
VSDKLEKEITFEPAYDKRSKDSSKDYGIHGVTVRFIVKGPWGATHFVIYTSWHLPKVQKELESSRALRGPTGSIAGLKALYKPLPVDVGYHALSPQYEGQEQIECTILEGGKCYCDGSAVRAQDVFNILLEKGSKGVWEYLEAEYRTLERSESDEVISRNN